MFYVGWQVGKKIRCKLSIIISQCSCEYLSLLQIICLYTFLLMQVSPVQCVKPPALLRIIQLHLIPNFSSVPHSWKLSVVGPINAPTFFINPPPKGLEISPRLLELLYSLRLFLKLSSSMAPDNLPGKRRKGRRGEGIYQFLSGPLVLHPKMRSWL